ncbi:unnamed protein product [Caenorhabditis brenneri]
MQSIAFFLVYDNPKTRNRLHLEKYSLNIVTQKQDVRRRTQVLGIFASEQPSTSAASNPKKREPRKNPKNMDEEETVEIPGTTEKGSTSAASNLRIEFEIGINYVSSINQ